jgi:hypothetical protein
MADLFSKHEGYRWDSAERAAVMEVGGRAVVMEVGRRAVVMAVGGRDMEDGREVMEGGGVRSFQKARSWYHHGASWRV